MQKCGAIALALPALVAASAASAPCEQSEGCLAGEGADETSLLALHKAGVSREWRAIEAAAASKAGAVSSDPDPRETLDDRVQCPGSEVWCKKGHCCPPIGDGNQCPGNGGTPCTDFYPTNQTFPCPLSDPEMDACEARSPSGFPDGTPLICEGETFFDCFEFYDGADPTNGYVEYVNKSEAFQRGLVSVTPRKTIIIGSETTGGPMKSVRLQGRRQFNEGIFILDLAHAPTGDSTWPAWWMYGAGTEWPIAGEFDMFETVNSKDTSATSLHTNQVCTMPKVPNITEAGDAGSPNGASVWGLPAGPVINSQAGRHIYAAVWSNSGFDMYYFTNASQGLNGWPDLPADIDSMAPDPSTWGMPWRTFPFGKTCPSGHFWQMMPIFDLTFCGDWAGNVAPWSNTPQHSAMAQCEEYVRSTRLPEAYWEIHSMRVFPLPAHGAI